jgi:hypothetical protein
MDVMTLAEHPLVQELGLTVQWGGDLFEQVAALLDGREEEYRYLLVHQWDDRLPMVVWVMLNPSVADALRDDPTIRRCRAFAGRWGCGGMVALNLFALRSTLPEALRAHADPVGPHNDRFLRAFTAPEVRRGGPVVAAWGNHGALNGRGAAVARTLVDAGVELNALVVTGQGQPGHPLYVRGATKLQAFAA